MMKPGLTEEHPKRQPNAGRAPISVMLVDNHRLLLESVEALIRMEPDLEFAGGSVSVHGLLDAIGERRPDVILMDIRLGAASGLDLIQLIRHVSHSSRVIILTAHAESEYLVSALNAGVAGYVLKTANSAVLMQAIRTVASGREYLCAGAESACLAACQKVSRPGASRRRSSLTRREIEVLNFVVRGSSNKLTARKLDMSPKTVAKHRANIMRKLNLHNISGLAQFAYRHGMLGEATASGQAYPEACRDNVADLDRPAAGLA